MNKWMLALWIGMSFVSGGCFTTSVQQLGKHFRDYGQISTAEIWDDGSLILTSTEFSDTKWNPFRYEKSTHFLMCSAGRIRWAYERMKSELAGNKELNGPHTWDDGLPILTLRCFDIFPAEDSDLSPGAGIATSRPSDARGTRLIATNTRDYRESNSRWRVRYDYGEVSCWLLLPGSVSKSYEDPGSGVTRGLLIGPAVLGDIVTGPIQYISFAIAMSQLP